MQVKNELPLRGITLRIYRYYAIHMIMNDETVQDIIDLIVHIFHPEKRKFYELEKIWSELIPKEKVII